ncbi:MAG: hypothetical protein R6U32_05445 [Candidatus Woesearchaeota archaeon]
MIPSSKLFWKKAREATEEMKTFKGDERQIKEYRKVAGQLFFYAGINAIEEVLSKKVSAYVVGNHEKRGEELRKHISLFRNGEKIERYYNILIKREFDYRRKVAYKGENGNKFALVEEFAKLCIDELENG